MAGDILYMTGQEMGQAISGYNQAVSGMTAAEAAAALGAGAYTTGSGGKITSFPMQYLTGGNPVTVEAVYASQMWTYWKTAGAAAGTTALGAAASAAKSWASGVLFGDTALSGTLAGTGGLLTMSLPVAASVIAPIFGVGIGAALYESNPELWTKISQTLLPWAYDDKQTIAAVVDENGQVYLPKAALEAMKQLLIDEGIPISGQTNSTATSDLSTGLVQPIPIANEVTMHSVTQSGTDVLTVVSGLTFARYGEHSSWVIAASETQGDLATRTYLLTYPDSHTASGSSTTGVYSRYQNQGKTVYYGTISPEVSHGYNIESSLPYSGGTPNDGAVAWTIIYGDISQAGEYQDGTYNWEGDPIDFDLTPTIPVFTDPAAGITEPYFPVTLPVGDPTESADPEEQPDPTAPVELPQLDPYIAPVTPPEMWPDGEVPENQEGVAPQISTDPIYVPTPDLNPEIDPSLEPDPEPAEVLSTEPPPTSSGSTPSISFPPPLIAWPSIVPASGSGLIHVYNPTPAEFIAFGNWLWVTYADPSIEKLWNNPFDGVIGAHELYATPSNDGTDTIKSGFLDSGISSNLVRIRYTTINCGSMVIPEYWGNYLDYSPYSQAFIYLPFIGIVPVDVDDIVGHAVNIVYHVDSYNGSCIAQITVARDNYVNTVYQFSGNCAVDLPLAGGSQSAIRAGMISAAAYGIGSTLNGIINGAYHGSMGGGAGAALGAIVGGVSGAVSGVANGVANVVSQKSTVQHSGSFGASYGAMGIKKPYIIIRRPVQKQVNAYQKDYGFPAHKRVIIGSCTGFLRVREVNVQSTLATDEEKAMIEMLLKTGVYVTE